MNRGMMLKATYELLPVTIVCGVLLFAMEGLLAYVLPTFETQLAPSLLQIQFIQQFISAMLGTEVGSRLSPAAFQALPWAHPVILALVWAHAVICCTRVPAGEVDRGTADVLLSLPVGRWEILVSETAVWLVAGAVMMALMLAGNLVGSTVVHGSSNLVISSRLIALANLFSMYVAVGSFSWFVASYGDRRGWAMTTVFVVLVASFLLNYLAQLWKPADRLSFLSLLAYYRPLVAFREHAWPVHDMVVLLVAAAFLWLAAGVVFSRRDICTV